MSNSFAHIVLFGWPLVVLLLFRLLPRTEAIIWSIVAGYLLLPLGTGFDLPLVPVVDKNAVPALAVILALVLRLKPAEAPALGRRPGQPDPAPAAAGEAVARPWNIWVLRLLLLLALTTPLVTIATNGAPVFIPDRTIRGLNNYDALSMIGALVFTLLPFLLAQRYLYTAESHAHLLRILVVAALAYSLLALWEVRMSPRLHSNIYGFFPHSFAQHFRQGGWRPLVFLGHGLWLGIFLAMAVLAALALWRNPARDNRAKWLLAALYLMVVLVLSKNLGALIISCLLALPILFLGMRGKLMLAGLVALVVLLYPMVRGAGLVPTDRAVALAATIDPKRAQSLEFRFDNEDLLLAHAQKKPLAGWGSFGRNRIFDEKGRGISTTDGAWIIILGVSGWLGYVGQFGLLCLPMIFLMFRRRHMNLSPATATLAVVMAAALVDLIPNATLTPLTWLVGGALAGNYVKARLTTPTEEAAVDPDEGEGAPGLEPARSRYSRFPPQPRKA